MFSQVLATKPYIYEGGNYDGRFHCHLQGTAQQAG